MQNEPTETDVPSVPPMDAVEPGHRARALAASLLGELTGQRRSSLSFSPQEPTGLASVPRTAGPTASSPGDPSAPAADAAAPSISEADRPDVAATDGAPAPSATSATSAPAEGPATAPVPGGTATAAPEATSSSASGWPTAEPTQDAEAAGPAPQQADAPTDADAAPGPAAEVAPRTTSGALATPAAPGEPRPAPFTYLEVAQHHTEPARSHALDALDRAGQAIHRQAERTAVRQAALLSTEATGLLDACDLLDERARAVDATWTGERHSATEVREFDGAWGAFYDAKAALAGHIAA